MGIEQYAIDRRTAAKQLGKPILPEQYYGVTKEKILSVLSRIDQGKENIVDAVFAMLCDEPHWSNSAAKHGFKFKDGATNAHIATHVGILQRGRDIKLDREGRDYWLKPLWQIGAVQKVTYDASSKTFQPGHKAKSSACGYRLADDFIDILISAEGEWQQKLDEWIREDKCRERLAFQAEQAEGGFQSDHSDLIEASHAVYAPRFLPGYQVVYIDDGDGDRISKEQLEILQMAGLKITLEDSMPDVLLWNPDDDSLWVIEAVTSDGEVDLHKMESLTAFSVRNKKPSIGFTTTYPTWKKVYERQSKNKNLAVGSYLWIREDASKNIFIGG
ncbi:BsuBI/PstI family type II restriction endonuclease [Aeromonas salmonicida]|uniref:BsuBI/PstI family type II restriction endonuclease n=1 Tax=Aeromonas salmonicida TaxID=645 RepID=UPI003F7BDA5B